MAFWFKWLPWRILIREAARHHGLEDPFALLTRLRRFAEPSEVGEPMELVRAGMVFHARGLLNSRVIQHNLDWVWPFWVERQFDPADPAFVPRAFSLTHVNLTHRNWTAVGLPDLPELPIVDPRGLLTPFHDGWSLDGWVLAPGEEPLVPSRSAEAVQTLELGPPLAVRTSLRHGPLALELRAFVAEAASGPGAPPGGPVCRLECRAASPSGGWAVLALRPCNPEGVRLVHAVRALPAGAGWRVDGGRSVRLGSPPERLAFSCYRRGDVYAQLPGATAAEDGDCDVGMATAAALYLLEPGVERRLSAEVELREPAAGGAARPSASPGAPAPASRSPGWERALAGSCKLSVPDPAAQALYDAALRTLVLLTPGDAFPGPYTYKRFWFRDAAFILRGLLAANLVERAARVLEVFPGRQSASGHFLSQEGEWDSNGQALWIMDQHCRLSGRRPPEAWREALRRGARWIIRKRVSARAGGPRPGAGGLRAGLMPPGFSAEHLGPNDFYYWDDFWSVAGLRSAGALLERLGELGPAASARREAEDLLSIVARCLHEDARRLGVPLLPAAPGRRMDAGAVGSLAAGYPLGLFEPRDPRLLGTARLLMERHFHEGAFFQDMTHSGLNAYLTLHVAQVLLAAGDPGHEALMRSVAGLASPTGQWPEAVHPRTGGGCMGDGQHAWAAAEWVLYLRNAFVREEGGRLILASGVPAGWIEGGASFGPTPTPFGDVSVRVSRGATGTRVSWEARWRGEPPEVEIRPADATPARAAGGAGELVA